MPPLIVSIFSSCLHPLFFSLFLSLCISLLSLLFPFLSHPAIVTSPSFRSISFPRSLFHPVFLGFLVSSLLFCSHLFSSTSSSCFSSSHPFPPVFRLLLPFHHVFLFLIYSFDHHSSPLLSSPVPLASRMPERVCSFQGQNYHKLKRACIRRGALFQDPFFPPTAQSLFYKRTPPPGITWKRPRVRAT